MIQNIARPGYWHCRAELQKQSLNYHLLMVVTPLLLASHRLLGAAVWTMDVMNFRLLRLYSDRQYEKG